jgi:hypothetical protein
VEVISDKINMKMQTSTNVASVLAILSAMITPAVLISACGTLVLSTSNRLSRAIDRARKLAEQFEQNNIDPERPFAEERHAMLFSQLARITRRTRLLHRALTAFYVALGVFVATSVVLAIEVASGNSWMLLPITLSFLGIALVFYAVLLLVLEARVARHAIDDEMKFILRLGEHYAPQNALENRSSRRFFPWSGL